MKLTGRFLALWMWCLPHWVTWRFGSDGRLHPIPADSYGRSALQREGE
jgi:hypothetical protein